MMQPQNNKMLIVAITGRSGSGKSSLTKYYASLGYPVQDGDQISRRVTEKGRPCLGRLVEAFGTAILKADGSLNRTELGSLAFASPENNERLIAITHPYIIEEFLLEAEQARRQGHKLFFVDGAMIVGGPFQPYCDKIIVVATKQQLSIIRIILRDGISKVAAKERLAAQQSEAVLRAAADYLIENNGGEDALYRKADEVLRYLLQDYEETDEGNR